MGLIDSPMSNSSLLSVSDLLLDTPLEAPTDPHDWFDPSRQDSTTAYSSSTWGLGTVHWPLTDHQDWIQPTPQPTTHNAPLLVQVDSPSSKSRCSSSELCIDPPTTAWHPSSPSVPSPQSVDTSHDSNAPVTKESHSLYSAAWPTERIVWKKESHQNTTHHHQQGRLTQKHPVKAGNTSHTRAVSEPFCYEHVSTSTNALDMLVGLDPFLPKESLTKTNATPCTASIESRQAGSFDPSLDLFTTHTTMPPPVLQPVQFNKHSSSRENSNDLPVMIKYTQEPIDPSSFNRHSTAHSLLVRNTEKTGQGKHKPTPKTKLPTPKVYSTHKGVHRQPSPVHSSLDKTNSDSDNDRHSDSDHAKHSDSDTDIFKWQEQISIPIPVLNPTHLNPASKIHRPASVGLASTSRFGWRSVEPPTVHAIPPSSLPFLVETEDSLKGKLISHHGRAIQELVDVGDDRETKVNSLLCQPDNCQCDVDDMEMPTQVNIKLSSLNRPWPSKPSAQAQAQAQAQFQVQEGSESLIDELLKTLPFTHPREQPPRIIVSPFSCAEWHLPSSLPTPGISVDTDTKKEKYTSTTRIPVPKGKGSTHQEKIEPTSNDTDLLPLLTHTLEDTNERWTKLPRKTPKPMEEGPTMAQGNTAACLRPTPTKFPKSHIPRSRHASAKGTLESAVFQSFLGGAEGSGSRRPSYTTANELLQDQLEKEKAKSQRLSVNLVSAQGVLSVPKPLGKLPLDKVDRVDKMDKVDRETVMKNKSLHDRLQGFVDGDAWQWHGMDKGKGRDKRKSQSTPTVGVLVDVEVEVEVEEEDVEVAMESCSTSTTSSAREEMVRLYQRHESDQGRQKSQEQLALLKEKEKKGRRPAMSPKTALKLYKNHLSLYEQEEISEYSQVYFVGAHARKLSALPGHPHGNFGYDDVRGEYHIVYQDHLAYRYEAMEELGRGSFGQVVKSFDYKTGQIVAIKIIRNMPHYHTQALVEIKILEDLGRWDPHDKHNIVRMTHHFYFRHHLCIAFECLSYNLYDLLKANRLQGLKMKLVHRFSLQILNCLVLLNKHKLIHCDLKPENIILKHPNKSTVKVIDFGSSCLESEKVFTYIQSRFYRSPEIMLGLPYTSATDMWSVGCILAELFTGRPLFPGENEQDQLACIMEIQGVPNKHLVDACTRRKTLFDTYGNPRILPNSKGIKRKPGSKKLAQVLKSTDENFVDFIDSCLQWDPIHRLSPVNAMEHVWILTPPPSSRRK
ncbi:hypothetical protein BDF14DRAFT_1756773 [Spinellus fusiger]|nr:hypothetical protein BDF14DRAFT_1756773 [Spinellus fusiger]